MAWDVDYSMVMNTFKEAGGPRCAAILLRSLRGVDQAVRDSIWAGFGDGSVAVWSLEDKKAVSREAWIKEGTQGAVCAAVGRKYTTP